MAAEPIATEDTTSWRELAVTRSLDPARARAEERVQRFIDAALDLMSDSGTNDFTVQQVVDRSGQSLRSFYQYFEGKHELLLALFEESIARVARHLAHVIDGSDDPLERLRIFTIEYYRICAPARRGKKAKGDGLDPRALAEFAQQLLIEHPREAAQAYAPLVDLLEALLGEATAAGAIRDDLETRRVAGVLLQAIMFNTFSATISGSSVHDGAEALLDIVFHGLVEH